MLSKVPFCLPHVRTNYGKFSISYIDAKVWNSIDEQTKNLRKAAFRRKETERQSSAGL